jgi:hypothetical protein
MTRSHEIERARMAKPSVPAFAPSAIVAALACLALLLLAPSALAAPVHPALPGQDIAGLNRACGAATDSAGDVYAASAGESKVKVFDPEHNLLATISDANQPCGLAVDSGGRLYVSEQATGNVVRYTPDAYPLSGTPSYGSAEPFDTSGKAKGISVDRTDDRLYVAEGNRISVYDPSGALFGVANEVQAVELQEVTGGTFKLSFEGQQTGSIPYNASAAEVKAALAALSTIGAGNVEVSEPGSARYLVTFTGALAQTDVKPLGHDDSALEGGPNKQITVSEQTKGFDGHIDAGGLTDATGVGAYTYGTTVFNTTHYLFVADAGTDRVEVLSSRDIRTQKVRETISGPKAGEGFDFGAAGAAIGVDPSTGHFFVYDDAHEAVDEFEASGEFLDRLSNPGFEDAEPTPLAAFPRHDEVQRLTLVGAESGEFTLTYEGQTTAGIEVDLSGFPAKPSQEEIQEALEALPAIGAGNVAVHGVYGNQKNGTFAIAFIGVLAERDVPALVPDGSALSGSSPTVTVTTATQGSGPGRLYVGAGAGTGAGLLAFGPLPEPSRPPLPSLSFDLKGAKSAAVDSYGDLYVADSAFIHVFGPSGTQLKVGPEGKGIPDKGANDLEVDSLGNLYALNNAEFKGSVVLLPHGAEYPPIDGTQYGSPVTLVTRTSSEEALMGIGLDPANDRLFVTGPSKTIKFDSAASGSGIVNEHFASGLSIERRDVAVYGANGDVYFGEPGKVAIIDPSGTEVLAGIYGGGSPEDTTGFVNERIAIDQQNGHVLSANVAFRGAAEEYDAAGAFVSAAGSFTEDSNISDGRIAIDNGAFSPNRGDVYVAYHDPAPGAFDITAFGPLSYGEAPIAKTGIASGLGTGNAILNGTVDPRGFELEGCGFQFLGEAEYQQNLGESKPAFAGAAAVPCAESLAEIGKGTSPVPVHADLSGLDPEARYRFRLLAHDEFGEGEGDAWLFGPPLLTTESALPIGYDEATFRAQVDPSGLATSYRFEYGTGEGYGQSTPSFTLVPGEGAVAVGVPLTGLAEGTTYHFRIVVENETATALGSDQTLSTLARRAPESCPNPEYRIGLSAGLPDCRAYELVTPAETGGSPLGDPGGEPTFNVSLTPQRGEGAGETLGFGSDSTLPGFTAVGLAEAYRASRASGAHPATGWSTELISTTYLEADAGGAGGGSPGLRFFFWRAEWSPGVEGTLPEGWYLRTPWGFEATGQGDLGTDLKGARSQFVSADGSHVVFSSKVQLEEGAPPAPTEAIYDRAAGSGSSEVVSVKPDGSPFAAGEGATYIGASEDGTAVAFKAGGVLYVHRAGTTTEVAAGPSAFAGLPDDGSRIFFAAGPGNKPNALFACDPAAGPCGEGEAGRTEIAAGGIFADVSADGSQILFSSEEALTGGEENEAGQHATAGEPNLYAWDAASETTRFVAILDPADFKGFGEQTSIRLDRWTEGLANAGLSVQPARGTPDGSAFAFQSQAQLTAYDNEGHGEIYRYDPAQPFGERLLCVSCDPSGSPPAADAMLQDPEGVVRGMYPTPNLTEDGDRVFFTSTDRLLPEDANDVSDVYEWQAAGTGTCTRPAGCLALISTGQGERPSFLYSMSADGSDVFFYSFEKLVGQDVSGSPSIYDARVDGGIPDRPTPAPCEGDACQGAGSIPPAISSPASATIRSQGNTSGEECLKSERRVVRKGQARCVKRHVRKHHKHKHKRRANAKGRASR